MTGLQLAPLAKCGFGKSTVNEKFEIKLKEKVEELL
jgi:hypothetical protein